MSKGSGLKGRGGCLSAAYELPGHQSNLVTIYRAKGVRHDMEYNYNFFADLLSTFRSCNDWIKALIILAPFATFGTCCITWLYRRPKPTGKMNSTDTDNKNAKATDDRCAALPLAPLTGKEKYHEW